MYQTPPDKKTQIKYQAQRFSSSLFPKILYVFDTDYDPHFTKNGNTYNFNSWFEKTKANINFENHTKDQLIYLFEEIDKSFFWFKNRHWTAFNLLFERIDRHNISVTPESLQKLFIKENLKKVRTTIKQRQREICSLYLGLKKEILCTDKRNIKSSSYNSLLFTSKNAQQWFGDTLLELNAIDGKKEARKGFQAKANAIFSDISCKKVIFKYDILLKDFIAFLNKDYKVKIKTDNKLSDGTNHANRVKDLIQLYQEP
jgi:hypothetical protein